MTVTFSSQSNLTILIFMLEETMYFFMKNVQKLQKNLVCISLIFIMKLFDFFLHDAGF